MKILTFLVAASLGPIIWFLSVLHDDTVEVRKHSLIHSTLPPIKIAVMGDFHFSEPEDFQILGTLKRQLIEHRPDLLLLLGDYTGRHSLFETHSPKQVAQAMEALAGDIPAYAVLGNHDNGRLRSGWVQAFESSSIELMENRLAFETVQNVTLCIVGHGDFYTGEWASVWQPPSCEDRTIVFTHDPYGLLAQTGQIQNPGFAGHTHCGQFVLPFGQVLYVPTEAPSDMHCGQFDRGAGGIVTGGLGYAVVDIRFGAGAELSWDLVQIVNE